MEVYRIKNINCNEHLGSAELTLCRAKNCAGKTVFLNAECIKNLNVGDKFKVITDRHQHIMEKVYMFRGHCYIYDVPNCDKLHCKNFVNDLPGLFDSLSLDRARFRIAIARECMRHDVPVISAWRNLRRVCLINREFSRID